MVLGGLALAFSRLIDNSVVVLENIFRHLELGEIPQVAAEKGGKEVALPVLAATLTTAVVFFPVTFLYGVSKFLFSALALAVVLSLFASYFVAHDRGAAVLRTLHRMPHRTPVQRAPVPQQWFNHGFDWHASIATMHSDRARRCSAPDDRGGRRRYHWCLAAESAAIPLLGSPFSRAPTPASSSST